MYDSCSTDFFNNDIQNTSISNLNSIPAQQCYVCFQLCAETKQRMEKLWIEWVSFRCDSFASLTDQRYASQSFAACSNFFTSRK